jgi:small subunit ribosomal protein S16
MGVRLTGFSLVFLPIAIVGAVWYNTRQSSTEQEKRKMVKIRMRRTGCTNHAAYRIVAADARSPRDGKFIEILGWYDTHLKENNFKLDLARVDYWLKQGAKPSTTVASLVRRARNPEIKPHHATKAKPKAEEKKEA